MPSRLSIKNNRVRIGSHVKSIAELR